MDTSDNALESGTAEQDQPQNRKLGLFLLSGVVIGSMMFATGLPVFWFAHRENRPGLPLFTRAEGAATLLLLLVAGAAVQAFVSAAVRIG